MTVWQSWVRQWYLSLGATAQVQFYGIYFFSLRGGQRTAAVATVAATAAHATCSHAVLVVSGMRAGVASRRDGGALWAHIALAIASAARASGRDASQHCLSYE